MATIFLEDKRQIHIELFTEYAPISVDNFIKLAKSDFYNGLIFHRVIPGFMIQGGGMFPSMDAKGGVKTIKGEFKDNGVNNPVTHTLGTLSMARTNVRDSATSQFFICVKEVPFLNGQYAAFGRVLDDESMKIAIDISAVPTETVGHYENVPVRPIIISKIAIHEE
ncbi:MAG: peptidylprolyl isomerase [Clostridia bacterium]|nr:peptidylprolyl isomerase [Clostridia bacterium]